MSEKLNVAVFLGGPSHEHEISRESGRIVAAELVTAGHQVFLVLIERGGSVKISSPLAASSAGSLRTPEGLSQALRQPVFNGDLLRGMIHLKEQGTEVAFIAIHGTGGEDGHLQGFLEWCGMPYTGAGVAASVVAMNKCVFKTLIAARGLPTAEYLIFPVSEWRSDRPKILSKGLAGPGLPCVIKSADLGSSFGVRLVRSEDELVAAIDTSAALSGMVLWERYVQGREVTCAVFGASNGELEVFPPVEVVPRKGEFFDYVSKYSEDGALEICPARLTPEETRQLQNLACEVHRLVGVDGMSRTDAILKDGTFHILETNTIPGMTAASLYPKAAAAAGVSLAELLTRACRLALKRRPLCQHPGAAASAGSCDT